MMIFRFLGQIRIKNLQGPTDNSKDTGLKLKTFVVHEIFIKHQKEVKGSFENRINHNKSFREFSKTEAVNLKKN